MRRWYRVVEHKSSTRMHGCEFFISHSHVCRRGSRASYVALHHPSHLLAVTTVVCRYSGSYLLAERRRAEFDDARGDLKLDRSNNRTVLLHRLFRVKIKGPMAKLAKTFNLLPFIDAGLLQSLCCSMCACLNSGMKTKRVIFCGGK